MGTEYPNRPNFPLRPTASPFGAPRGASPFSASGPVVGAEASAFRPTPPVAGSQVPTASFTPGPVAGPNAVGFRPVPPAGDPVGPLPPASYGPPRTGPFQRLPNLDDYSPPATLIPFDRPIPLLRGPIKANPSDDPELSGPFVLAFKDPKSWAIAYKNCESKIIQQCEAGVRIGCSLSASNSCKPRWWKTALGLAKEDFKERAKCEEREMEACFVKSKEKCGELAAQKCSTAFRDSRIAVKRFDLMRNRREVSKLISWACLESNMSRVVFDILKIGNSWEEFDVSYCRGSDLLGSNNVNSFDYYLKK